MAKPNNAIATIKIPGDTDARPIVPYYLGVNKDNDYVVQSPTLSADALVLTNKIYEVDAVTRPTSTSNYVVYHITEPRITSLTSGLTVRVHKGLRSDWPNDSDGAVKLIQINDLDPIAIFWRYNSFAAWNPLDHVYMTLTYCPTARPSTSDYYGYTRQDGFIMDYTYDSGNDIYNLYDYGGYKVGATGLTNYSIVGYDTNGNRIPVIQGDGTLGTIPFVFGRGIAWWDGGTKTANTEYGAWNGSAWVRREAATILAAFVTAHSLGTVDYNTKLYLKGSISGNTMTPIALTTSLPSTADGYYYMYLMKPYQKYTNNTGNENWVLDLDHPIFTYRNGAVVEVVNADAGGPSTYLVSASASGNTLTITPNSGSAITYIPTFDDSNLVHKGTNSSSVAETIYGEKSFGSIVRFGAYSTGAGSFLSEGSISSNSLGSLDITAVRQLVLSASGYGLVSSGFSFKDIYKPDSSTTYTSTYSFPNRKTENKSYTIATTEDIPIKGEYPNEDNGYVTPKRVLRFQQSFAIAPDPLHNINNHDLSGTYTATSTTITISGINYPVIIIQEDGSSLSTASASNYMMKMTGSEFVPMYGDGTVPRYSYMVIGDGYIYKPQYDSTNGLVLWYVGQMTLGGKKYRHNITIILSGGIYCTFSIINSSSTQISSSQNVITALYNAGFRSGTQMAPAQGQYAATGYTNWIIGVYASSTSQNPYLNFRYITLAATSGTTMTVNTTPSSNTGSYSLTSASITDVIEVC